MRRACSWSGRKRRLEDRIVRDLPDLLRPGDVLVLNDTKVIPVPAPRPARRARNGRPRRDHAAQARGRRPLARLRPAGQEARRRRPHPLRRGLGEHGLRTRAARCRGGGEGRGRRGALCASPSPAPFLDEAIARLGELPLPPYIAGKRPTDERDRSDYQTVYARDEGAVAAPTAGLHFTDELFRRLDERGVVAPLVTLHVGAGTFLPVKAEDTDEHRMHAEWGAVRRRDRAALNEARAGGGRIVAVGTTSLRLLESAAREDGHRAVLRRHGDLHHARLPFPGGRRADDQFPPAALDAVHAGLGLRRPRAHAGGLRARDREGYRFYSYGDASLLFRRGPHPSSPAA